MRNNQEKIKVLYNSLATTAIYDLMKKACPCDIELLLLEKDDNKE